MEQVLKGAKRQFAEKNPSKKPRLPMTPDILLQMRKVWNKEPSTCTCMHACSAWTHVSNLQQ